MSTPTDFTVTAITHHQCAACDEAVSNAIATARVTGSTGGTHVDGNHAVTVERRLPLVSVTLPSDVWQVVYDALSELPETHASKAAGVAIHEALWG